MECISNRYGRMETEKAGKTRRKTDTAATRTENRAASTAAQPEYHHTFTKYSKMKSSHLNQLFQALQIVLIQMRNYQKLNEGNNPEETKDNANEHVKKKMILHHQSPLQK